jgi:DNA-binding response OmpR family regulator
MTAPRILIVDDDPAIRESLATELGAAGFVVDLAGDGREGLRSVSGRSPDLVLTDPAMPVMDGSP